MFMGKSYMFFKQHLQVPLLQKIERENIYLVRCIELKYSVNCVPGEKFYDQIQKCGLWHFVYDLHVNCFKDVWGQSIYC